MNNGDKVKILLKNGFHYNGVILESSQTQVVISDKYGKIVQISKDSISVSEVFP